MTDKLTMQVKGHMEAKSTEELLAIWVRNDRVQWSASAFEAVRLILEERHMELPEQDAGRTPGPDTGRKINWRPVKKGLGIGLIVFSLYLLSILVAGITLNTREILSHPQRALPLLTLFAVVSLGFMVVGVRIVRHNRKAPVPHTPEQELRKHQTRETLGAVMASVGLFVLLISLWCLFTERDGAQPLTVRTIALLVIFLLIPIALAAFGVRIVLHHHPVIVAMAGRAARTPVRPPYLTPSGTVRLSPEYVISPCHHSVADPSRAFKRYISTGVSRFALYPILGLIASVVAFVLFGVSRQLDLNPEIPRLVKIGTSMLTWFLFCAAILALPCSLLAAGRCLWAACMRPDLSTPEKTVKCFLQSIRVDLKERAYNLLTDQAQNLGKVDLTKGGHALSGMIPEVLISDLPSFQRWWAWANVRVSWRPLAWDQMVGYDMSWEVCILEIPMWVAYPPASGEHVHFRAVFPVVRRHNIWFLTTPFIWPFVSLSNSHSAGCTAN